MDFITSDRTLACGDLVFSRYNSGDYLYKITNIQRRFLDQNSINYGCYSKGQIGDEYNPYVTVEAVANLSISADPKKKMRKKVLGLDAAHLIKADPNRIKDYIKKLSDLLVEMF